MLIYRVKVQGVDKPFLARADGPAAIRTALVTVEPLTKKELADAFGQEVRDFTAQAEPAKGETGAGE